MKKLPIVLLAPLLSLAFDHPVYSQGTMVFNNLDPSNGKILVSTGSGTAIPLDRDLNFELRVYTPGGGSLLFSRKWLLSDGTANGIHVGPGLFDDPSHSVIALPGIAPGEPIPYFIWAWSGNYTSAIDASGDGAGVGGNGSTMFFAGSIEAPPAGLINMPGFTVAPIPEPRIGWLASVGLAIHLVCHQRRS